VGKALPCTTPVLNIKRLQMSNPLQNKHQLSSYFYGFKERLICPSLISREIPIACEADDAADAAAVFPKQPSSVHDTYGRINQTLSIIDV
jgi:hypothetical protein